MSLFKNAHLLRLIALLTCAAGFILILNYYTIKALSSIRAYINGESQYSKGEKDASQNLILLIDTEDPKYWQAFLDDIAIPQGDSLARGKLLTYENENDARLGFLAGRNHPEDLDKMIWAFQSFRNSPFAFMKEPIQIWKEGDSLIYQKYQIGLKIKKMVDEGTKTPQLGNMLLKEIADNSNQLTLKERAFSDNLGATSRRLESSLFILNIVIVAVVFLSIKVYAYQILSKLNSRNLELITTNNELDKFVYSASHDLRAPISSLKGLVSISKFENDPVKLQSYFDLMNQTLDKQDQFIKDIIDYSLNKKNELSLAHINLSSMIDDAVNEHLYMPGANEIKIAKELAANDIQSDPKRLSIAINNLISNVFKYQDFSKKERTLTIRSRVVDRSAFIEVEDNGIGIQPKHHAHIFDMFYVVTAGSKGSGLGLYITRETINKLGGDIFVSSKINFGTKFTIRLPQPSKA